VEGWVERWTNTETAEVGGCSSGRWTQQTARILANQLPSQLDENWTSSGQKGLVAYCGNTEENTSAETKPRRWADAGTGTVDAVDCEDSGKLTPASIG
jgi:hypothetical protein